MSGIFHEWNGTVLTITSDSGTSSADLKGGKGDDGIRGPQGPAGDSQSALELDTTLTEEGKPADAKAVGDRFAEVDEALGNISFEVPVDSVNGKTGEVVLTAEDVGAISSSGRGVANSNIAFGAITEGLLANGAVSANKIADGVIPTAISDLQNDMGFKKIIYSATQPTDWVNGDIWLKPAT